jgi:hypothetical protein
MQSFMFADDLCSYPDILFDAYFPSSPSYNTQDI